MNKRNITFASFAVIILLAIYLFFIQTTRGDKKSIELSVFPASAEITIDGSKVNKGTVHLDYGVYKVEASQTGFINYSNDIVVNPSTDTYAVILEPESEEAQEWFKNHQKEYADIRKLSEKSIQEKGEYFHKQNPIASKLPYRSLIYTIGYMNDQSDPSGNSIIVTIDAPEGYKQAALYRIRQLGFDPTDLNIIFRDYENPFPL